MSDYIKREDAIKYNQLQVNFCKQEGFPNPEWLHIESILNNIKHIPSADVVEQKHGKWFFISEYCRFACNQCNGHSQRNSDYCPNCGARMDGD